ncbi:MAG: thermonuclease family protein [Bilophila wadsworthia]
MHTLAQMLSAVLVTAFFVFQTAIAHADGLFSATVTQCTDGDTLVLDTGQRVRLAGVDTPEKGSKDTPPQYYAREAARFTCERTRKQRVKVIPLSGASRVRYQRLVAEIILPDGRSLNEQLLQQAWLLLRAQEPPQPVGTPPDCGSKDALDKRAGCWGFILTVLRLKSPTSAIGTANVFLQSMSAHGQYFEKIKSAFGSRRGVQVGLCAGKAMRHLAVRRVRAFLHSTKRILCSHEYRTWRQRCGTPKQPNSCMTGMQRLREPMPSLRKTAFFNT